MSVNVAGPRASSARVEACLAAIGTWQSRVNAMVTVTEDAARAEAAAADRATSAGRWLGRLHGLPMVIKDNRDTAGVRTTSGSLLADLHRRGSEHLASPIHGLGLANVIRSALPHQL